MYIDINLFHASSEVKFKILITIILVYSFKCRNNVKWNFNLLFIKKSFQIVNKRYRRYLFINPTTHYPLFGCREARQPQILELWHEHATLREPTDTPI